MWVSFLCSCPRGGMAGGQCALESWAVTVKVCEFIRIVMSAVVVWDNVNDADGWKERFGLGM